MTQRRLLLIVLGLFGIAITWWVVENLVWEDVRIPGRPKGEAVSNQLFAAQKLLQSLGANASSDLGFKSVPEGDPSLAAIVLPTQRRTLTPDQRDALEAWAEAGGHLVVVAYSLNVPGELPDTLLDKLGVTQTMKRPPTPKKDADADGAAETDEDDQVKGTKEPPSAMPWLPKPNVDCPVQYDWINPGLHVADSVQGSKPALPPRFPAQALRVCFDDRFSLTSRTPPLWRTEGPHGTHALMLPLGKGRVTVLTDWFFLRNGEIGRGDHADFLVAILGPELKGLRVLLVPAEDVPGLHAQIWQHGAMVVLTLLLLLIVLLWRGGTRLGPVAVPADPVRRSLLEHVHAMGEFIWREQDARALWKSAVTMTRKRIARVLPATNNPDVLIRELAKRSALPESLIRESLFPEVNPDADRFARAIATLEKLRKSL